MILLLTAHLTFSALAFGTPASSVAPVDVLLARLSAPDTAGALLQIRCLGGKKKTGEIICWFFAMTGTISLLTLPFGWRLPQGEQRLLLGASSGADTHFADAVQTPHGLLPSTTAHCFLCYPETSADWRNCRSVCRHLFRLKRATAGRRCRPDDARRSHRFNA
ncbi:hypothetical protein [Pantoea sp. KPR_PJ]|uniref:hypothetical protein n=1 Tax=Pantoea sp. KPR_PJ TaxID=2738375 RepID=UPI003529B31A